VPRVPSYQPDQVGPVETTRARHVAANNNGGALGGLGEGLQIASSAVANFSDTQERLIAENDDTQARLLAAEASQAYSTTAAEYGTLQAGQAREAQPSFNERLAKIRDETLGKAANGRQKRLLEERLIAMHGASATQIATHAVREAKVERKAGFAAQEAAYSEAAARTNDPVMRDQFVASAVAVTRDRLIEIDGMDPEVVPELFALEELKVTSAVHGAVVDRMFAVPDPQVDEVMEYLDAYGDEMTADLRSDVLGRLQSPLQDRMARSDADVAMGFLAEPEPAASPVAGPTANLDQITAQTESGNRDYVNGRPVTSPVGARFAMQVMPATARDPGFGLRPADPNNADDMNRLGREYRAKMEERYSGDLAKMWAAYNAGPGRVDQAIKEHGGDWLAHMPAETRNYVKKNVDAVGGRDTAYANAPREWDRSQVEAALNEAAEREGWSPERTQRARTEMERRIDRDEALLRDQQADADEAAAELVQGMGNGFTSTNQIPRDVWNKMSPTDRIAWEKVAEDNRKPVEPVANGSRVMELNLMRYYEPEKFKSLNIGHYAGEMTRAELDTMLTTQAKMRTTAGESLKWSPRAGIVTALNYGKKINEMDLDKGAEAAILQIMEGEANAMFAANGGKPLTENDYQALFRSATRKVKTTTSVLGFSTGSKERARYELTLDMMPSTTRERLTRRLNQAGLPVNDENLLRLYRLEQ
jgi:soluble lytic murein transglycosylase